MITMKVNQHDSVLEFYDTNGKSILKNNPIEHSFFDAKFNKKRVIKLREGLLHEDYCISEADTIYNYIQFDESFYTRLNQFYSYLEQQVVYPQNALKKGIKANVKVSIVIDRQGSITQITAMSKHEWGFEESLMRALKDKKQFGFILYKDRPVKLYLEIPFAFKIVKK